MLVGYMAGGGQQIVIVDAPVQRGWYKCTATWVAAHARYGTVLAKLCEDEAGTNPTGSDVTIYLPRSQSTDPNLHADDIISAEVAANGHLVSSDGADAKAGSVKLWAMHAAGVPSDIPRGWKECGTANTMDPGGRFIIPRVANGVANGGVAGAVGGTGDYAKVGDQGGKAYHGQTENGHPDHADHTHYVTTATQDTIYGSNAVDATHSKQVVEPGVLLNSQNEMVAGYDANLRHGGGSDGLNTWPTCNPTRETHPKADTDNRPCWQVWCLIQRVLPAAE
jgi:hypothetical protein